MIDKAEQFKNELFATSKPNFDARAIDLFHLQYRNNGVYKQFVDLLGVVPAKVVAVGQIPFLHISFFKQREIKSTDRRTEVVFESSGTTRQETSKHSVVDLALYRQSILNGFKLFYDEPSAYAFVAMLPGYVERSNSSLVYMADQLIKWSGHPLSGFYLGNDKVIEVLKTLNAQKQKTILLGVSFALLDLVEKYSLELEHTIVMETGGMKGKRDELTREELHHQLELGFGVNEIHSEYGMTELLSQAYSNGKGLFRTPPWMRVEIRDMHDPYSFLEPGKTGAVNVIDFANLYSCPFIATDDLGKKHEDGTFEILGRMDNAEIRGCNLMFENT